MITARVNQIAPFWRHLMPSEAFLEAPNRERSARLSLSFRATRRSVTAGLPAEAKPTGQPVPGGSRPDGRALTIYLPLANVGLWGGPASN